MARLLSFLFVGVFALAFVPVQASAQPPSNFFTQCVSTTVDGSANAVLFEPEGGTPTPLPDPGGEYELITTPNEYPPRTLRSIMYSLQPCALAYADTFIVPLVRPWFNGLLIILVVWTGVGIAFGRSIDFSKIVSMITTIGFASILFNYYYSPILGLPDGVPRAISEGANVIAFEFFDQADHIYYDVFETAYDKVSEQNTLLAEYSEVGSGWTIAALGTGAAAGGAAGGIAGAWIGGFCMFAAIICSPVLAALGGVGGAVVGAVGVGGLVAGDTIAGYIWVAMLTLIMWSFLALLHIIYWIIMSQYLWGYFGLAVISMFGPIFIPLLLLEQTADYFWGWFKALINYAFYMITGAAMYVVVSMLLELPLDFATQLEVPLDSTSGLAGVLEFGGNLFTRHLPVIVMGLLASLNVGALSNTLTSGAPPMGAGLLSRLTQAGAGLAAVGAVGHRMGDARNRYLERQQRVLSERTRTQREAVEQGKETFGGSKGSAGSPGGGGGGPGGGGGGPDRSEPADGGPVPIPKPRPGPGSGPTEPESQTALREYLKRVRGAGSFTEIQRLTERFTKRIEALHRKESQSQPLP